MYNIEDLTEQARRSGASDIHLVCGLPPKYRLDGQLENMAEEHLSEKRLRYALPGSGERRYVRKTGIYRRT